MKPIEVSDVAKANWVDANAKWCLKLIENKKEKWVLTSTYEKCLKKFNDVRMDTLRKLFQTTDYKSFRILRDFETLLEVRTDEKNILCKIELCK